MLYFTVLCFSVCGGFFLGRYIERKYWKKAGKIPIPGQRVWLPGIGNVFILGYLNSSGSTSVNDIKLIEYVPEDILGAKLPSQIPYKTLNQHTVSVDIDVFLANYVKDGHHLAAKL